MEQVLLIDYENVQSVELSKLPKDVHVLLILGSKQTKLPTELVLGARERGERFHYVPIRGQAPNAVDFSVAYYLGEVLTKHPRAECVVLSKDKKGFDPLVKHLSEDRGLKVRRVSAQKDAFQVRLAATPKATDPYARTLELLSREKHLPAKLTGLEGKLKSYFSTMAVESRKAILDRLLAEAKVTEAGGKLRYAL